MARNKTLFIYNTSKQKEQEWSIYSENVINKSVTVGSIRKTYTISLSGDATIQFGVNDTVYLRAEYNYSTDSWKSHTDTPKEINFTVSGSAVTVSSSYSPELPA
ncbi:hypothetical protein [Sorangium sp. So ce693]|uniref:hypothetical protein n=1 Tax=Sorangium sp. So ce693 TaxID=3133318 RepID=UPI003F624806